MLAQTRHRGPTIESTSWLPAPMVVPSPTRVRPRRITFGSRVTSGASSTPASTKAVAGSCIVTPARIQATLIRSRRTAVASASWTRSLIPSSVPSSGASNATTVPPPATARSTSWVR